MDFLEESEFLLSAETEYVTLVCSFDSIGFHALENKDLLLFTPRSQIGRCLPDDPVHFAQLDHEYCGLFSPSFQKLGFSSIFLYFSIDVPLVQVEVIVFEFLHEILLVQFLGLLMTHKIVILLLSPLIHQKFTEIWSNRLILLEEHAILATEFLFLSSL